MAAPAPDGSDTVRGGADGDILSTRDLGPDAAVNCGGGRDALRRDALDLVPVGCETQRVG